jgi:hypothetical protein
MMKTKSVILFAVMAASLIGALIPIANEAFAQSSKQSSSKTGNVNTTLSATINMFSSNDLAVLLTASGGNFSSADATVSVSADNENFIAVDTVGLGTATTVGLEYHEDRNATTIGINPALYPFVKVSVPAITGVTVTATWTIG